MFLYNNFTKVWCNTQYLKKYAEICFQLEKQQFLPIFEQYEEELKICYLLEHHLDRETIKNIKQLFIHNQLQYPNKVLFKKGKFETTDDYLNIPCELSMYKIPDGWNILTETDEYIKIIKIEDILDGVFKDYYEYFTLKEWETICHIAKVNGKVPDLLNSIQFDKKSNIIKQILSTNDPDKKIYLQKQLQDVIHNSDYWFTVRQMVHAQNKEALSFSLSATLSSSQADVFMCDDVINEITYSNTLLIKCAIHLEDGPMVLWMNDNALISNPVCGHCADAYLKYSNKSVYHESIVCYIPTNIKTNEHFLIRNGFDFEKCQWLSDDVKLGITEQLIRHVKLYGKKKYI